jgi:hypothetical protein
MDAAQARYFETGKFEPPTADNPVSIVPPKPDEPGIIAFHGSGADFDEFRLEMIGTGEGAQAYGYGLYFTDSEDIARFYKDAVGGSGYKKLDYNADADASQSITDVNFKDVDGYRSYPIDKAQDLIKSALKTQRFNVEPDEKALNIFEMTFERDGALQIDMRDGTSVSFLKNLDGDELTVTPLKKAEGKMYKVGLAPKPDELLDYDAPFSAQSKDVQEKLLKAGYEVDPNTSGSGGMILDAIMSNVGREKAHLALGGKRTDARQIASQRMAEAGIPGIRYATNDTRSKQFILKLDVRGKPYDIGTEPIYARNLDDAKRIEAGYKEKGFGVQIEDIRKSNYVIFDDKAVKILEKYGIVGPVAVTAAGAAAVNRGRNDNDNGGSILPDAGIM